MKYIARVLLATCLLTLPLLLVVHSAESAKPQPRSHVATTDSRTEPLQQVDEKKVPERESSRPISKSALDRLGEPTSAPTNTLAPLTPTQTPQAAGAQSAQTIQNNWLSINQGGATEVSNGNLKLGISIAQPVAGYVESGNLALGLGYWYGAAAGTGGCDCPWQSDYNEDSIQNAVDLNFLIDVIFFGEVNTVDPSCPGFRMDYNCSGEVDAVDINFLVDLLFFGGPPACDPCTCPPGSCVFP